MDPVVLFRSDFSDDVIEEKKIIEKYLPVSENRVGLADKLVIGRYSVLPYYKELEKDLALQGSRLVNTFREHNYIADFHWYEDVKKFTPETWFRLQDAPKDQLPFVLKGRTNSRKFEWDTHMLAKTWADVYRIERDLMQDGLIGDQDIVIRKYEPLKTLEVGLNGLPFANEWRFFFYKCHELSHGFYWSSSEARGKIDEKGVTLALDVAHIIEEHATFFVLDIAQKENGEWILIEVNDGQMSGLSENDPDTFYSNLANVLKEDQ